MAENSVKKRKRQSNGVDLPNKKAVSPAGAESSQIKVHIHNDNGAYPVLLSSPGLVAPRITFNAYRKPSANRSSNDPAVEADKHDILLHSSEHPRLDYTAAPTTVNQPLSHYVAVFDPSTKQLQITPACNLSLRSTLRSEAKDDAEKQRRTITQQRAELGREFGTKKAKKAIAARTVNAIDQGAPGKGKAKVQDAILESMADTAIPALNAEEQIAAALAAKPIPKPNPAADKVEDVYTFDTLIPDAHSRLINVKEWQEKVSADVDIHFGHLYPASRVVPLARRGDVLRLKALRYLTLLLEFHDALLGAGRTGKKVPKKETLKKRLTLWPESLVDAVRVRFATQQNELPKWHMDNLYTHICALSLYVDGWTTEISQLKQGLKMENRELVQYYRELGCKIAPPTEKEKGSVNQWWGGRPLTKEVAAGTRVAKLTIPPEFPKARGGRRV